MSGVLHPGSEELTLDRRPMSGPTEVQRGEGRFWCLRGTVTKAHRMVSCCKISRGATHREVDLVIHSPVHWELEISTPRQR